MAAKQASGENLTEDEQARLSRGAFLLQEIERNAAPVINARRNLANIQEQQYLNSLLNPEAGNIVDPVQSARLAAAQYKEKVISTIAQLQETENGAYTKYKGLSDDQRREYVNALQRIDFERYENEYADRILQEQRHDYERRAMRTARLREQGTRMRRNAAGWGGNGFASRIVRQWESGKDAYASRVDDLSESIRVSQERLKSHTPGSANYGNEQANLNSLKQQLAQTQKEAAAFAGGMGLAQTATAQ